MNVKINLVERSSLPSKSYTLKKHTPGNISSDSFSLTDRLQPCIRGFKTSSICCGVTLAKIDNDLAIFIDESIEELA